MSSRTFTSAFSCTSICSANDDRLRNWLRCSPPRQVSRLATPGGSFTSGVWQIDGWPLRQNSQWPQKTDRHEITWSPGFRYVTSAPTCSTTPADSWPRTTGIGVGYAPSMKCRSLWQRPAAAVRTSTSRPRGLAIATSSIVIGWRASWRTAAFIGRSCCLGSVSDRSRRG